MKCSLSLHLIHKMMYNLQSEGAEKELAVQLNVTVQHNRVPKRVQTL